MCEHGVCTVKYWNEIVLKTEARKSDVGSVHLNFCNDGLGKDRLSSHVVLSR